MLLFSDKVMLMAKISGFMNEVYRGINESIGRITDTWSYGVTGPKTFDQAIEMATKKDIPVTINMRSAVHPGDASKVSISLGKSNKEITYKSHRPEEYLIDSANRWPSSQKITYSMVDTIDNAIDLAEGLLGKVSLKFTLDGKPVPYRTIQNLVEYGMQIKEAYGTETEEARDIVTIDHVAKGTRGTGHAELIIVRPTYAQDGKLILKTGNNRIVWDNYALELNAHTPTSSESSHPGLSAKLHANKTLYETALKFAKAFRGNNVSFTCVEVTEMGTHILRDPSAFSGKATTPEQILKALEFDGTVFDDAMNVLQKNAERNAVPDISIVNSSDETILKNMLREARKNKVPVNITLDYIQPNGTPFEGNSLLDELPVDSTLISNVGIEVFGKRVLLNQHDTRDEKYSIYDGDAWGSKSAVRSDAMNDALEVIDLCKRIGAEFTMDPRDILQNYQFPGYGRAFKEGKEHIQRTGVEKALQDAKLSAEMDIECSREGSIDCAPRI